MSEENIQTPPATFNDGSKVEETILEASSHNTSPEKVELSEIERQAYDMGWRPKEEYSGENFVPAQEYINRAPLFQRIERQSKEIRELKDLIRQTTSHLSTMRQDSYEKALQDLEAKRLIAVESGNMQDFRATEMQVQAIRQKMQSDEALKPHPITPDLHPDVIAFGERNKSWYNESTVENKKMKATADAIDNWLAQQANIDGKVINPKEHLKTIEAEVRRVFPHRFDNPRRDAPTTVGKSSNMTTDKALGALASKLSPQQLKLGQQFQKSNPEYTLEKYAKDLDSMGRLGK